MNDHHDDDTAVQRDADTGLAIENLVQHRRQRRGEPSARKDDGPMAEVWKARRPDTRLAELRERQQWRAATIQIIKEQERARIARELHDDLGGTLAAIKIELTRLRNRLGRIKGVDGISDMAERVGLLDNLVDQAFSSTRRVSGELRPALLDLGVNGAITWLATEFEERSGIGCAVMMDPQDIHGGEEMVLALARIVQESLTNISKHAHASHVEIAGLLREGMLELSVRDDGRGFAPADLEKGDCSGVRGIRERARALGGEAFILSNSSGTTVTVRVPFDATGESEHAYMGSTLPTGAAS